jgi:O-methyltransferase
LRAVGSSEGPRGEASLRDRYLETLKAALTGSLCAEPTTWQAVRRADSALGRLVQSALRRRGMDLARPVHETGSSGRAIPPHGVTMIGRDRLDNVQACVEDVLRDGVPGDLIEAGVWRGGACIFMCALLEAYGDAERRVWVADSFAGLPRPDPCYPADEGDRHHRMRELAVSRAEVEGHFARYGLLDKRVRFVEGWFRDTLPALTDARWAIVRLDGDMYGSTLDGLRHLYPRLSPGGFLIVDDYGAVPGCRQAVDDFRASEGIREPLVEIDWTGVYWRRSQGRSAS